MNKRFLLVTVLLICFGLNHLQGQNKVLPTGFFNPKVTEGHPLYLFDSSIVEGKIPRQALPVDSITFKKAGYNWVVDHSPKDFEPFMGKLDYGVFFLSVNRLGIDYHEVFTHEEKGTAFYVGRFSGDFISWGEFLLSMHSVEFMAEGQKVFDHPLVKSAGRVYPIGTFFRPMFVQGDWMEVQILDNDFNKTGKTGWIRWRKDGKILVLYNLLS
tara:strand:- start:188 stop:826 length:639 start_codon:yes stop_codon:yes gene_type:complete